MDTMEVVVLLDKTLRKRKGNGTGTGLEVKKQVLVQTEAATGKGKIINLAGRYVSKHSTKIDNNCNQAGKLVLEVTVDKSGKVVSATNGKGSTADLLV